MRKIVFGFIAMLAVVSCRKEPSKVSGTGSQVYDSDEYVDIMTNFSGGVNTATLLVENANLYNDIVGNLAIEASKSTMDGKPVAINNIEVSNLRITTLDLYSGYDINQLDQYLDDAKVFIKYLDASSQWVSQSLGTLSGINTSSKYVTFNLSGVDLSSFVLNNPDRISFELQFNGVPTTQVEVKYHVGFSYNYSYETHRTK